MKLTFLKLYCIQTCKILCIFLIWIIYTVLNENKITVTIFYGVTILYWVIFLWYMGRKIKKNNNLNRTKKVILWILFTFFSLILFLPVIRIIDIFKPIHSLIRPIVFFVFHVVALLAIEGVLAIKIKKNLHVKANDSIHQVLEWNKKIKDYPDEGIFYDSFGCGIISVFLNAVLITVCFVFVVFLIIFSMPKDTSTVYFINNELCICVLITSGLYVVYSCNLFLNSNSTKRFRRQTINIMLLMINLIFDLLLYFNKIIYTLPFSIQMSGILIFLLAQLKQKFFKMRYGTFKSNENIVKELDNCNLISLQEFLKCDNKPGLKCLSGDKDAVNRFVDLAYELQLAMIKCGQLFKERKDYYDYMIRINCAKYDSPEEACEDIKNKLKEYFNIKHGIILGKKYIIELISRVKPFGFLAGFLQISNTTFFDEECSRINVILDNYYGYSRDKEWIKKLCVFASKLQFTLTFTSKSKIEEPNESFFIEEVRV